MKEGRLLITPPQSPAFNMALDEALLESPSPVLRFYQWEGPCVSFGYFQEHGAIRLKTPLPLVRRRTGGGLVSHGPHVTFSLVLPEGKKFFKSLKQGYALIHAGVAQALNAAGWPARLAPSWCGRRGNGDCFTSPVCDDVLLEDKKVAGGAQWWSGGRLLHQGEVAVPWSETLVAQFGSKLGEAMGISWEKSEIDLRERDSAQSLRQKYASTDWTEKC